jgi:hypothetical protein
MPFWDRMEQIRVAVEIECQAGDALHAELGTEFETFLAKEIKPKPAPPKFRNLRTSSITRRFFPDVITEHPESSRKPSWYRAPFERNT